MLKKETQLQKALNIIIRKKYSFIKAVEVLKVIQHFSQLRADINFYITEEFLKKHVRYDCYDQMEKDDDIFFALFSFNWCSDVTIDESEIYDIVESTYKMMGLSVDSIYSVDLSLSVLILK